MNTRTLFTKFAHGLNWNAALYISYKTLHTALSFWLLKVLPTNQFSLWANINAVVFLLLLWIDFGFRKSVPRFVPEFWENRNRFILAVTLFQCIALIISLVPLYYLSNSIQNMLHHKGTLFTITSFLFISEGLVGLIRLISHSYFLHKQFNGSSIIIMMLQMLANIGAITTAPQKQVANYIIGNKIIANIAIIISGIVILTLCKSIKIRKRNPERYLQNKFIKHSALMWMSNNIKSLSERNFLVPFLTTTIGPAQANLFKVANDAALFFYRIVIKTIGTTDTSLLSYIQAGKHTKKLMRFAFTKLSTKVAALCLPLLGVIGIIGFQGYCFFENNFVYQAFLIMATGYMFEMVFLPFERVLEIKANYVNLFLAYTPYIIMMAILLNKNVITSIGLLSFIAIIHFVRLVSISIVAYRAHLLYGVSLPTARTLVFFLIFICIVIIILL